MKTAYLYIILFFTTQFQAQEIALMTYNIRLDVTSDGENSWPNRKEKVAQLIHFHEPDILGIQEGLPHQVDFLKNALTNYVAFGQGRDGHQNGEHSTVFYKKERFELLSHETFWLSETPNKVTKGWDAALNRICTFGLFKDKKTNKVFYVFNTHFDHVGEVARSKSAQLIHQKITEINTQHVPVILMGDFNLEPTAEPLQFLSNHYWHSKHHAKLKYNEGGTFNAFAFHQPIPKEKEIDHIFVSKEKVEIHKYAVLNDSYECKYPSDHFPVWVELTLK